MINAALKLFARNGVGGTSLRMIASELGVTVAAVYHQYKTKDEIIYAAADSELRRLERLVDAAEAEPTAGDAREVLVTGMVDLAVGGLGRSVSTVLTDPIVAGSFERHARFLDLIPRMRRLLMGDGPSDEPRIRTATLIAVLNGAAIHPFVAEFDDDTLREQSRSRSPVCSFRHSPIPMPRPGAGADARDGGRGQPPSCCDRPGATSTPSSATMHSVPGAVAMDAGDGRERGREVSFGAQERLAVWHVERRQQVEEGLFELLGRRSEGRQQWIGLGQDGLAGREQRCDHRERGLERRHHRERLRGERPEEGHERGEGGDTATGLWRGKAEGTFAHRRRLRLRLLRGVRRDRRWGVGDRRGHWHRRAGASADGAAAILDVVGRGVLGRSATSVGAGGAAGSTRGERVPACVTQSDLAAAIAMTASATRAITTVTADTMPRHLTPSPRARGHDGLLGLLDAVVWRDRLVRVHGLLPHRPARSPGRLRASSATTPPTPRAAVSTTCHVAGLQPSLDTRAGVEVSHREAAVLAHCGWRGGLDRGRVGDRGSGGVGGDRGLGPSPAGSEPTPPDAAPVSGGVAGVAAGAPPRARNVPSRCQTPVKLLNGPPMIRLVHSRVKAPVAAS